MKKLFTLPVFLFLFAVFFKANAQCDPPVNLTSSYSNNVSTFTWDAIPGASYTFQFKFQWDSWNQVPLEEILTSNSYSLTGLFQSAPFEWRVNTICGSNQSAFSPAQSYATPCPQPSGLTATNIAGTTATLNWIPAPGYNTTTSDFVVSYRIANTSNPWISLGHTSAPTKNVTGLLSNTTYEWRVSQSCMYSLGVPATSQFTTMFIACNIPTNLTITNISGTQATVSWAAVSGGQSYSIEYKPVTSSVWSAPVISTTLSKVITGLTQSTLYDCRVKANCNATSSGYVSKQFTTYTTNCASYGLNNSEWIDYVSVGSITRTSGAEIGGYYKSNLSTNLARGSSNNNFNISAGYVPGITLGEYFAVYIDFNRNGTFGDVANERVIAPSIVISNGSYFGTSFSIPNNVVTGATKMRVILRRYNTAIVPCATGFSGETEDYDVNITNYSSRSGNNPGDNGEIVSPYGLTISPNPSEGLFTITLPQEIKIISYEVVNSNGAVVQKRDLKNEKTFTVDITSMPDGMYILRTTNQNGIQKIEKLIKN